MVMAALALDWLLGDPRWLPHPVTGIGKLIAWLERKLYGFLAKRLGGIILAASVTLGAAALTWCVTAAAWQVHPWLGYAAHTWLISTTLAVKGLKDAAMEVYHPLMRGDLEEARSKTGMIVGRDTEHLDGPELTRAAVETVAENTTDAFVAPLLYALLGAAPLAMFYRAANTLDSMVGYRNAKYARFGWASARLDDALNWIPARVAGVLLLAAAWLYPHGSATDAWKSWRAFAHLHPSPNSGIPEAAVAGALGIRLGGVNRYGGIVSERAYLGWAKRPLVPEDIRHAVRLLDLASYLAMGGLLCGALAMLF